MSEVESFINDPQILRELIMDHYQYPHNHKLVKDDRYLSVHMASDSCIDDITVQSDIKDGVIQDIRFEGVAKGKDIGRGTCNHSELFCDD